MSQAERRALPGEPVGKRVLVLSTGLLLLPVLLTHPHAARAASPASGPASAAAPAGPAEPVPGSDEDQLRIIRGDPANPTVADMVYRRRDRFGSGDDAFARNVKAELRSALEAAPGPQVAWNLAAVIQDQLAATSLQWSNRAASSSRSLRGDPGESFLTLAAVLERGFDLSAPGDLWQRKFGTGLARLRLLQGDWQGMNAWLTRIGVEPMPDEERPFLTAPPADWSDGPSPQRSGFGRTDGPRKSWQVCEADWRTGECSLAFRFEKDGRGLGGVHVLIKEQSPETNVYFSGIEADTLFLSDTAMCGDSAFSRECFGYRGSDRARTRYAISGADGRVLFERLPAKEVRVEVLVPTANFDEPGRAWDLFMETEPGRFQLAQVYGEERIDPDSGLASPELNPGRVTEYPRMVVRPQVHLPLDVYIRAGRHDFVLKWEDPGHASAAGEYQIELKLIGPPEMPTLPDYEKGIATAVQTVAGTAWPLGEKGVGGLRLVPGGLYTVRILVRGEDDELLARSRNRFLWVPWEHRESEPPSREHGTERQSPIHMGTWYRGTFRSGLGPEVTLQTRVQRFLSDYPNAFEREYVQVGKAFLDWHDGKLEEAHEELERLVKELPAGSVPQATAEWLLAIEEEGASLPKRLELKPPQPNAPSRPAD